MRCSICSTGAHGALPPHRRKQCGVVARLSTEGIDRHRRGGGEFGRKATRNGGSRVVAWLCLEQSRRIPDGGLLQRVGGRKATAVRRKPTGAAAARFRGRSGARGGARACWG